MIDTLDAQLRDIVEHPSVTRLALMLYGSVARGTADIDSDIDLLELVPSNPTAYKVGRANITQYVPAHLHAMASQGSLFVLHLRLDGVVLLDEQGTLRRGLDAYAPPAGYQHIWHQVAVAAGALDSRASNFNTHVQGLARLGIYLLRTAAYVRSVELGQPEFDIGKLGEVLGYPELGHVLAVRRREEFTANDVANLRRHILRFVPAAHDNPYETVEAYAVANSERSDLASLFAAVMTGGTAIDYSTLTVPPF